MLSSLDYDCKAKQDGKYSVEREQQAKEWIETLTGERIDNFEKDLKSGIILCKLASFLTGKNVKYSESKLGFKQMENISTFLTVIAGMG
jgi:transgelin